MPGLKQASGWTGLATWLRGSGLCQSWKCVVNTVFTSEMLTRTLTHDFTRKDTAYSHCVPRHHT